MNSKERLQAIGELLYGARWKTSLARDLNVTRRRVHQWMDGDTIPPGVWLDLERLEVARKGWPRDEWLVAIDTEGLREYIIHTRAPRFIARLAHKGEDADVLVSDYECRNGKRLCEVVWSDPVPVSEPELLDLFQRAEAATKACRKESNV